MANFNKLEMAQALMSHNNIQVKKSFFGQKLIYSPTSSPVKLVKQNYPPEALPKLRRIVEAGSQGELVAAFKALNVQKQAIGNVELDACVSADKNFVAVQLLQFADYTYRPVTEVAFFENDQAQLAAKIL